MKGLTQKEIIDYLYQCYVKVDGLWFLKVEEQFGFDKALAIDKEVWKVVPKLQARFLKSKLCPEILQKDNNILKKHEKFEKSGELTKSENKFMEEQIKTKKDKTIIACFIKALRIKLNLDRFKFTLINKKNLVTVKISECPWHNILIKSKREKLSSTIGSIICKTEYKVFANEFIPDIKLEIGSQICRNENYCLINFVRSNIIA